MRRRYKNPANLKEYFYLHLFTIYCIIYIDLLFLHATIGFDSLEPSELPDGQVLLHLILLQREGHRGDSPLVRPAQADLKASRAVPFNRSRLRGDEGGKGIAPYLPTNSLVKTY